MQFITNINQKGQVVIPAKIRKSLKISPETPLTIIQFGENVVIQPTKITPTNLDLGSKRRLESIQQARGCLGPLTQQEKHLAKKREHRLKTRINKLRKW